MRGTWTAPTFRTSLLPASCSLASTLRVVRPEPWVCGPIGSGPSNGLRALVRVRLCRVLFESSIIAIAPRPVGPSAKGHSVDLVVRPTIGHRLGPSARSPRSPLQSEPPVFDSSPTRSAHHRCRPGSPVALAVGAGADRTRSVLPSAVFERSRAALGPTVRGQGRSWPQPSWCETSSTTPLLKLGLIMDVGCG